MPIRVRGTISIQRKSSSRGAFNVGDLDTEIGSFEVKDSLIEEFEPGKYTGEFIVRWIAPDSFTWRGRVFVKNRATLEAIFVDGEEEAPAPTAPPEPDPLDHQGSTASSGGPVALPPSQPAPAPAPAADLPAKGDKFAPSAPVPASTSDDDDLALFGLELHADVQRRQSVKLDPTVDRQQFRRQRDRLKELGYQFDAKIQTWLADRVTA